MTLEYSSLYGLRRLGREYMAIRAADMSGRADQPDTDVNDPLETLAGNFHSAAPPEYAAADHPSR